MTPQSKKHSDEHHEYTPNVPIPEPEQLKSEDLHPVDADSSPGPANAPVERPPYSTSRPDVPIVQSMTLGAAVHDGT
jgi:hypothetical protein